MMKYTNGLLMWTIERCDYNKQTLIFIGAKTKVTCTRKNTNKMKFKITGSLQFA